MCFVIYHQNLLRGLDIFQPSSFTISWGLTPAANELWPSIMKHSANLLTSKWFWTSNCAGDAMHWHLVHGHTAVPPLDVPANVISINFWNFSFHSGQCQVKRIQLLPSSCSDIILNNNHMKQRSSMLAYAYMHSWDIYSWWGGIYTRSIKKCIYTHTHTYRGSGWPYLVDRWWWSALDCLPRQQVVTSMMSRPSSISRARRSSPWSILQPWCDGR
jgi:hypothetical protein